jgi:hypothetical protein
MVNNKFNSVIYQVNLIDVDYEKNFPEGRGESLRERGAPFQKSASLS